MNLMTLFAFLTLSGQQAPPPPGAAIKASAPARPVAPKSGAKALEQEASPEAVTALLEAALQYSDGADLECERQMQCLRDTWSGSEDENMDCAPMLAASQAKAALAAAKEACGMINPQKLTPADSDAVSAALQKLSSSAQGLELRARELAAAGERASAAAAAYESGVEAAEAANQLQEMLDQTIKKFNAPRD